MGSGNLARELTRNQPDEIILEAFREVGQILADARKEKNLTIWQVAAQIHIRQQYLADLEEGHLSDLPGRVYILGFIRTYARLLNLDGEELIRRVSALPNLPNYTRSQASIQMHAEEEPNFPVLMISAILIVLFAIGGYFFLKPADNVTPAEVATVEVLQPQSQEKEILAEEKPDQSLQPPVVVPPLAIPKTQVLKEETVIDKSAKPANKEPDAKAAIPDLKKVILKAREPSWVEIRDEAGRVSFMRVLQRGEEYVVPNKPGCVINTGNAGGIDIFVGDQKLPSLGGRGEVKRGIRPETLQ